MLASDAPSLAILAAAGTHDIDPAGWKRLQLVPFEPASKLSEAILSQGGRAVACNQGCNAGSSQPGENRSRRQEWRGGLPFEARDLFGSTLFSYLRHSALP